MKVKDLLQYIDKRTKIHVSGSYKYGLVVLYKGKIEILQEILKVIDILDSKNWGNVNEEFCFLYRDVEYFSPSNNNELFISIKMPNSYLHEDKNGNRLDEFIK